MMIDQDKFFSGMGLERYEITYKAYGTFVCYKDRENHFYKLDHFAYSYVIEAAENEEEARKGIFEDTDLFDDTLSENELIRQVHEWLRTYAAL